MQRTLRLTIYQTAKNKGVFPRNTGRNRSPRNPGKMNGKFRKHRHTDKFKNLPFASLDKILGTQKQTGKPITVHVTKIQTA